MEFRKNLSMEDAIQCTENVYKLKSQDKTVVWPTIFYEFDPGHADMDIKSGYLPEQHIFGHKTVAFMEANVQKGLPDLVGLIAVFSSETGMPLGLVDGSSVTGMRTGAAGAIGAKYLVRKNSQNALIVGTGNQAPFQIAALLKVFPTLETIQIANPHNAGHDAAFASKIRAMLQTNFAIQAASVTFEGVSDLQEAVSDSDIIITITPSHTPLIPKEWVKPGTHFSCIGADMAGKEEIDSQIFKDAIVFVDDLEHCRNAGEIEIPLKQGTLSEDRICGELGDLILGGAKNATIRTYFYDKRSYVCCLEIVIAAKKSKTGEYVYSIPSESLWEKPIATVKSKKYLTDFTGMKPVEQHNSDEAYLSDDVSFVIAHNKKANDTVEIFSLLSYTNVNVLPFTEDIPLEVIAFLDPTIEKLCFEQTEGKTFIHLKFKDEEEIILNNAAYLEQYLSSGTIKGIITFSMVKEVLHSGGYLLVDEIENHFNKEIVTTLVRFFMDSRLNKNGGTLIFTTHYPELLDEYDRNDGICIVRNRNGITAENLSYILKRNDIKKSDAYQSGFLEGTTPAYEAYMRLKKSLAASIN